MSGKQILALAKATSPDFFALAKQEQRVQVLTIAFSHYCEFPLWALKQAHVPFHEHGYAPMQHVLPVLSVRVGKGKLFSNSSRVTKVSDLPKVEATDKLSDEEKKKMARKDAVARSTAVPLAITPEGEVLRDSWEIAALSKLPPASAWLHKLLDRRLGPLSRQYTYAHVLKPSNRALFNKLCCENQPLLWRVAWKAALGNRTAKAMDSIFRPRDANAVAKCREDLDGVLSELDHLVVRREHRFLEGDQLGLADLATASLLGPLLSPPQYCEGKFRNIFDELYTQDAQAREDRDYWRSREVGKYAMQLYADFR